MALLDILQSRVERRGRTAAVNCGALGAVTVESLPLRECAALSDRADGDRAVFYAACRMLQTAGDTLQKRGQLFTPDGIMQYITDTEAAAAASVIRQLSGLDDLGEQTGAPALVPVSAADESDSAEASLIPAEVSAASADADAQAGIDHPAEPENFLPEEISFEAVPDSGAPLISGGGVLPSPVPEDHVSTEWQVENSEAGFGEEQAVPAQMPDSADPKSPVVFNGSFREDAFAWQLLEGLRRAAMVR